jgi:hypothetical protein
MPAPKGHKNYATDNLGGRPKTYTPEFIEKEAVAFEEWIKKKESVFYERFCFERGYSFQRLLEFVEVSERFADAYALFKTKQKFALYEGGLIKKFQYNMCALVLANSHGVIPITKTENATSMTFSDPFEVALSMATNKTKDLVEDENS